MNVAKLMTELNERRERQFPLNPSHSCNFLFFSSIWVEIHRNEKNRKCMLAKLWRGGDLGLREHKGAPLKRSRLCVHERAAFCEARCVYLLHLCVCVYFLLLLIAAKKWPIKTPSTQSQGRLLQSSVRLFFPFFAVPDTQGLNLLHSKYSLAGRTAVYSIIIISISNMMKVAAAHRM